MSAQSPLPVSARPDAADTPGAPLRDTNAVSALAEANARLRLVSEHLVGAEERERTRIARELHDGLGQMLTGVVIQLHAAQGSSDPVLSARCTANALALALDGIRQVKSMSFELRPAQLEMLGLVAAVKATLDRQRDSTGVHSVVRVRGSAPRQVLPTHYVGLRILQEALNNVLRHAQAGRIVVRLRFNAAESYTLTVGDDGCGYDTAATLAGGLSEKNLGLRGMQERAEMMGGRLRLRSTPGRGSVVRLSL
jgi:signal transduction histidine kinase